MDVVAGDETATAVCVFFIDVAVNGAERAKWRDGREPVMYYAGSKFSTRATNINEIPNCEFQVLDHAASGRPGGCYLDVPTYVLHQTITESEAEKLLVAEVENSRNKN